MIKRLQVNQAVVTHQYLEEICRASSGKKGAKAWAINHLYWRTDQLLGIRRKDAARCWNISTRTLNRWVNEFNKRGIWAILETGEIRRGRKRKVERTDFHERILPAAEQLAKSAGEAATVTAMFRSARAAGIFIESYSTFRRCVGGMRCMYRKQRTKPRAEIHVGPTVDEWLFFSQTGNWPEHLKAFGRRFEQQQKLAFEHLRTSLRQEPHPGEQ